MAIGGATRGSLARTRARVLARAPISYNVHKDTEPRRSVVGTCEVIICTRTVAGKTSGT